MTFFDLDETGRGLDRVLNFSDGVFAIAITLLVLAFHVPDLHGANVNHRLLHALLKQGGLLIGFTISFFAIARLWMAHHRLTLVLRRLNTRFIALNLVFLAFVVFLPFPTAIIGLYGATTTGVVFYTVALSITTIMSTTVWSYAFRAGLVDEHAPPVLVRQAWMRSGFLIVVFGLSIPVAFISPGNAQLVWLLLVAQAFVPARFWGNDQTAAPIGSRRPSPKPDAPDHAGS